MTAKALKTRYQLCNILTTDEKLIHKSAEVREKFNVTHEEIYRRGLEIIEQGK
jgi:hypothetical protein